MLYRFKSHATAELTLLQPAAEQLLRIVGKAPAAQGLIRPEEVLPAIAALEQAIATEGRSHATASSQDTHLAPHVQLELEVEPSITLAQRASPFIQMLREAAAENVPVTWAG
jgi:hypothetical protein